MSIHYSDFPKPTPGGRQDSAIGASAIFKYLLLKAVGRR
ncbi:hypothetical protein GACE_0211 [Geoglobus acetivorans]|uniref:Uncharacterized protein n=1 Tax=Geoglobus acetivorans TaxID=565033 RepID=A0A0A7GBS1_GEOAI|nr:hypothetical protein GACE_0211 [Geoglobus acetivorans]